MNEVITRLNEIEEKADAIIEDAKARKKQLGIQIEQDKKSIDARFDEQAKQKMIQIEEQLQKEAAEEIDKMQRENQEHIAALEAHFSKDREAMAEEVFRRVIEG